MAPQKRFVDGTAEEWAAVAEAIVSRRHELGMTREQAVSKAAGMVSLSLWANLETARQTRYLRAKILAVCSVLGWTHNSLDLVMNGDEPIEIGGYEITEQMYRTWQTETSLQDLVHEDRVLRSEIEELRGQIADLRSMIVSVLGRSTGRPSELPPAPD